MVFRMFGGVMRRLGWAIGVLAASCAVGTPVASGYKIQTGRYHSTAIFGMAYSGSGSWRTIYHSEPPNPGGKHDTNDANDSSAESWSIAYSGALTIPRCGSTHHRSDPCTQIQGPTSAIGPTRASGEIDHTHVDGLYSQFNTHLECSVQSDPSPTEALPATVSIRYSSRRGLFWITAMDPVSDAFDLLPGQCPSQTDPIDGLYDNYLTPGFSFQANWGPVRWFTAARVAIPGRVLHRATKITIALSDTGRGTPPANCAVPDPSTERCSTGGTWSGVLTLSRRG